MRVVIPDLWGKSSDKDAPAGVKVQQVVIPDLWGKSSDFEDFIGENGIEVVIPDLWGKSSDLYRGFNRLVSRCRNPRFVGQVFRRFFGT